MNYIAIIGNIIHSKQVSQRSNTIEVLKQQLNSINYSFSQNLASPFTLTKGDEFQALCKPNPHIFLMIDQIQLAFRDQLEIKFGIGLGKILTAIDPKQSIGVDGPAYWEAQKAIKVIQDKDDYGSSLVAFSSEYKQIDRVINPLLTSSDFIKATWNSSQTDLFEVLISNKIYQEEFKQKPIAEKMKLSQSAFTKRLKSSGIKLYFRNRKTAMDLILQLSQRS
ncbi:SatD family protein [Streptococcus iners]|uniref:SatD family protein n=1 Tax=Streptococcus iners subsp. hyiners TaxID=3028083 RepID=A0AA96VH07_9STRE|nr:SatD family protein [Streptococcus sp. 29892]MCK4028905.1 DNA-binding protein [Streptococcus suis]WNY48151.1 SatD family protein [Streptococcus sp. 29892]